MEKQPLKTIPIHEHLRPRLCDTYENDSIFDKFEVVFSGDGSQVMTGSYNNNFMIYPSDPEKEMEVVLQADKSAFKAKKVGIPTPINGKKQGSRAGSPAAGPGARMRKETDTDQIDFNKKILHMSWHPFEDSIAIAATNNVSILLSPRLIKLSKLTFPSSLYSQRCRSNYPPTSHTHPPSPHLLLPLYTRRAIRLCSLFLICVFFLLRSLDGYLYSWGSFSLTDFLRGLAFLSLTLLYGDVTMGSACALRMGKTNDAE